MPRRPRKSFDLPGVHTVPKTLADGTVKEYSYLRGTGIPIVGERGSDERLASYLAAKQKSRERPTVTLKDLMTTYFASVEFRALAESTKREYRRMGNAIEVEFGTMPKGALEDPDARGDFLDWRDKLPKLREAENRLTVLSAILAWGVERRKLKINVLASWKRAYSSDRSEIIWLPEHIEAFTAVASPEMYLALSLALYSGQSQAELLRLKMVQYRDGELWLRREKTGAHIGGLTCVTPLRKLLEQLRATRAPDQHVLLTPSGKPWQKRWFSHTFKDTCNAAGIPDHFHFHDLRGTAVTSLWDAGCTEQEIASVTGHTLKSVSSILQKYTARTSAQTRNAMAKLEAQIVNQAVNREEYSRLPLAQVPENIGAPGRNALIEPDQWVGVPKLQNLPIDIQGLLRRLPNASAPR